MALLEESNKEEVCGTHAFLGEPSWEGSHIWSVQFPPLATVCCSVVLGNVTKFSWGAVNNVYQQRFYPIISYC